jgi:hypothetical protein
MKDDEEQSEKNLPFPKSNKNRTCRENVGVEWDCTCRCRMETEGNGNREVNVGM